MITCSKCKKEFSVDWRNISKDSTVQCISCGNECLVKLFDLEQMSTDSNQGFSSISDIDSVRPTETKDKIQSHNHFLIIIFCFTLFIILFILGMYKIPYVEQEFPLIGRFYNKIRVIAHKTIHISSIEVTQNNYFMTIKLDLMNLSNHAELLNDIEVLLLDPFNNIISSTHITPHKIIKTSTSISTKINIADHKDDLRTICIFINGKVVLNKKLPI